MATAASETSAGPELPLEDAASSASRTIAPRRLPPSVPAAAAGGSLPTRVPSGRVRRYNSRATDLAAGRRPPSSSRSAARTSAISGPGSNATKRCHSVRLTTRRQLRAPALVGVFISSSMGRRRATMAGESEPAAAAPSSASSAPEPGFTPGATHQPCHRSALHHHAGREERKNRRGDRGRGGRLCVGCDFKSEASIAQTSTSTQSVSSFLPIIVKAGPFHK